MWYWCCVYHLACKRYTNVRWFTNKYDIHQLFSWIERAYLLNIGALSNPGLLCSPNPSRRLATIVYSGCLHFLDQDVNCFQIEHLSSKLHSQVDTTDSGFLTAYITCIFHGEGLVMILLDNTDLYSIHFMRPSTLW